MDSNAAFVVAVRASKRVRGISAPPEQPLEHTTKRTRSRNRDIQDIPAFRRPGEAEATPPSPRSSLAATGNGTEALESGNATGEGSGHNPPPGTNGTTESQPSGKKKKKKKRGRRKVHVPRILSLLTVQRPNSYRNPGKPTSSRLLGRGHAAVSRKRGPRRERTSHRLAGLADNYGSKAVRCGPYPSQHRITGYRTHPTTGITTWE